MRLQLLWAMLLLEGGYVANSLLLKPALPENAFVQFYLNDVLGGFVFVIAVVLIRIVFGDREATLPISLVELLPSVILLGIWTEIVTPHFVLWATPDPLDAIAYLAGALVAWVLFGQRSIINEAAWPFRRLLIHKDQAA